MLGAKARAAEYNAAKAASARQASREAEEYSLPPKSTPISLSAFTKAGVVSRNRGTKVFKPLVLPDTIEDDQSTNSRSSTLDKPDMSLPTVQDATRNRPSSLPATIYSPVGSNRHSMVINSQSIIPYAPRAMLLDGEASIFGHSTPIHFTHSSLLPVPQFSTPPFLSLPITPAPHFGWYTPGLSCYDNNLPFFPVIDYSPVLPHSEPTHPSSGSPEIIPDHDINACEKLRSKPRACLSNENICSQPQRFVFGPDDLSPSKAEVKARNRCEWMENNVEKISLSRKAQLQELSLNNIACQSPLQLLSEDDTMARMERVSDHEEEKRQTLKPNQGFHNKPAITGEHLRSEELQTKYHTDRILSKVQPTSTNIVPQAVHRRNSEAKTFDQLHRLDPELLRLLRPEERLLLDRLIKLDETRRLSHREEFQVEYSEVHGSGQTNDISSQPLFDINSKEWCEWKPITQSDREKIGHIIRRVRASETIDIESIRQAGRDRTYFEKRGLKLENGHTQQKRREEVADLVKELLKSNDEYDKICGKRQVSKSEAMLVKAVGSIYISLNAYEDELKAPIGSRLRTFVPPPNFAVERSIQLGREKGTSLFGADAGEAFIAPTRIARDPRFRPQPADGINTMQTNDRMHRLLGGMVPNSRRL